MSSRRLFFALWPDQAMREALSAAVRGTLSAAHGGRPMPPESLHLTLAFLGAVPESSVAGLCALGTDLARQSARRSEPPAPLHVTLDTIEYWRQARILCVTAARESPRATSFADTLRSALSAAGFRPDLKPFRAHVTLARQLKGAPREARMPAVTWTFEDFVLVESRPGPEGSSYSIVASWTLCGAAGPASSLAR